jgi:predicted permease
MLTAPLVCTGVGLLVGVTPVRDLFYASSNDASPPLALMVDLLTPAGHAAVTALLLVVGFSFAKLRTFVPRASDGLCVTWVDVAIASVCRLIVVPGMVIALTAAIFGVGDVHLPPGVTPTAIFVALSQSITPPAIVVVIITQSVNLRVAEATMLLFWMCKFSNNAIT